MKIAKDHTAAMVFSPSTAAGILAAPFTFGAGSVWLKGSAVAAQQAAKQAAIAGTTAATTSTTGAASTGLLSGMGPAGWTIIGINAILDMLD